MAFILRKPSTPCQITNFNLSGSRGAFQGVTLAGIILVTFDRTGLFLMIVVLPPLLVGTWIGWRLYGKLNERRFRQMLALLLIGLGITLAF